MITNKKLIKFDIFKQKFYNNQEFIFLDSAGLVLMF